MFDELETLAIQLAPELAAAGLVIIPHQDDWPIHRAVNGYAVPNGRHHGIRDYLRATGRWTGRWPSCIVICGQHTPEKLLALTIHEAAHLVPARPAEIDDEGEPTQEDRDSQTAQLVSHWSSEVIYDPALPWRGHDLRWIRRVLHLADRAARLLGFDIHPRDLSAAGDQYGLSHIRQYAWALGCEPMQCFGWSFDAIERLPLPLKFVELFCRDVSQFYFLQLTQTEKQE